jgi:hypothetical protein
MDQQISEISISFNNGYICIHKSQKFPIYFITGIWMHKSQNFLFHFIMGKSKYYVIVLIDVVHLTISLQIPYSAQ